VHFATVALTVQLCASFPLPARKTPPRGSTEEVAGGGARADQTGGVTDALNQRCWTWRVPELGDALSIARM
jgi:hypothetical protein